VYAEMIKYSRERESIEVVVEYCICKVAWMYEVMIGDWRKVMIVPLYKNEGDRSEYKNHREISLLSVVGKVYGKIEIARVRQITEYMMNDEQGEFRSGKGRVNLTIDRALSINGFEDSL